ncbi:MAG: hypothetical protein J6K28_06800 [Alistipes sp.]|nr:hypothetical protein [Alistipes sp.]
MSFDDIKSGLERLQALVDGWKRDGVSELERDIALEELRSIYAALRFGTEDPCASRETAQPVIANAEEHVSAVPANTEVAQDRPSERTEHAEQPNPQIHTKQTDASVPYDGAENGCDTIGMPSEGDATAESALPDVQADVVPPFADSASETDETDTAAYADGGADVRVSPDDIIVEPVGADGAGITDGQPAASAGNSSERKSELKNVSRLQSLFGEDEMVVSHRRRMIMMSLYDEEPAAVAVGSDRAEKTLFAAKENLAEEGAETVESDADTVITNDMAFGNESSDISAEVQGIDVENISLSSKGDAPQSDTAESISTEDSDNDIQPSVGTNDNADKTGQKIAVAFESEPVLGEVMNTDVRTLADTIAPARNVAADVAGKSPVDDLGKAIGVNDRFLLIRDLFGGSTEAYEQALRILNGFDNLDDCMVYIVENYDWNPNADGTKLLMELIERKYNR